MIHYQVFSSVSGNEVQQIVILSSLLLQPDIMNSHVVVCLLSKSCDICNLHVLVFNLMDSIANIIR